MELVKTIGDITVTHIIADDKSYSLLKVVGSNGLVLGAAMDTGTQSFDTILSTVKNQVTAISTDPLSSATEVTDSLSALSHLNDTGTKDFDNLQTQVKAAAGNATSNLNAQLKTLHARLDRIDDDLIAHYAGISQLVLALSANPFTAASAALSLPTYNFSSIGQKMIKKLMHMIPGYDTFKQLQHLDTTALFDGIASKLESQVGGITAGIQAQFQAAVADQIEAIRSQATTYANYTAAGDAATSAAAALQNAIDTGASQSVIDSLTTAKFEADNAFHQSNQAVNDMLDKIGGVDKLAKSIGSMGGVLNNMKDIAKGTTYSSVFNSKTTLT